MIYKISQSKDLEAITELAHIKNNIEEHHIPYCCQNRESIHKDFDDMLKGENHLVVTAWDNDKLCGVLGLYCIDEINRADCVGPFVDGNNVNSQENEKAIFINVAKEMVALARKEYPTYHFSFIISSKNNHCLELMEVLESKAEETELELGLKRENFINKAGKSLAFPFSLAYEKQLRSLHEQIAPDVYLTSNQLIKTIGREREVYLLVEENLLIAYGVLHFSTNTNKQVCVEMIGVDKNHRGKGYGRMILNHLLGKAFERKSTEEVNLIVDAINTIALNLYESLGFESILERRSFTLSTER
ncbi:GNAT family N-acetyltransferase [Amphibacillus sp. Q70]|uniref:GNAT family N-acetyltransferase n=1 Tax=Amphibacillus sp. Q70 TaxID=3453416 RepID=UPI003F87AE5D